MQRILFGLMALFFLAACTPKATTTMSDKADKAATMVESTMKDDFRAKAPEPGPAPEIDLGDFQDFKLDNGLQVILVENHKLPRVSYQLFVDVPPLMEGKYAGASGMMGDMLRRATSEMTKEEIDEAVDFIGANLSTSGSGAFASTISKYKTQMMEMMGKVVLDARFPEEEFAKVKDDALAGLKSSLANPNAIAGRVRRVLTFGADHPYGELNTEETLSNVTLDVVQDYYNTYFVPNRSYLVMVGDLTRSEAEMMAQKTFGDWQAKDVPTTDYEMPPSPEGVVVNFVPRAGSVQSILNVSHAIDLKPGTTQAIQAGIVNSILGSGSSGRLFQNLREDKGYTYGAYSSISNNRLVGNFNASASVRNEVTDSAVQQLMLEIANIGAAPVSAEELDRAKSQLNGSFGRALESPQRIASYALSTIRYGLPRNFYPTYLQKVEATTAADLQMMAKKYIATPGTNIIVVGDKAVAEKLAQFATSGKVNYFDVNGNPLDMDAMAAPTDVTPKSVIMKYVDAIGGMDAINKINNYSLVMEAEIQGQKMSQTLVKDGGNRLSSQMTMMGMTMMDQRYDNGKSKMVQQGQTMPPSPEVDAALKDQAILFPVVSLLNDLDNVTVSGTEMVDGKKVVVLNVKGANGDVQRYFDLDSGLQVREIRKQGPTTVTMDLSDYQDVGGVKMPGMVSMSGMAPFPIEMKLTSAEANVALDESLFKVE